MATSACGPSFEARKGAHLPSERNCAHPGMTVAYAEIPNRSQSQIRPAHVGIGLDIRRCALHQHAAGLQDVVAVGYIKAFGHALLDDQYRHAGAPDALYSL